MLFVDGMLGVVAHNETVQWLYTLCASQVSGPSPVTSPLPTASAWASGSYSAQWARMELVCGPSNPRKHFNAWAYSQGLFAKTFLSGTSPRSPSPSIPGIGMGLAQAPLIRGDPSP